MSVSTAVSAIDTQTLTYLPTVIAGIQAAEAAAPTAPGASKLDAVLAGVGAASQVAEGIPIPQVQSIAALVNLSVLIFNLLGAFKHKTPRGLNSMHPDKLREKLKDALRKTGHVSEQALDAVAETAVTVVLANAGAIALSD